MSIRNPADALTKAGDIRAASDRIRTTIGKDFSGLQGVPLLSVTASDSTGERQAARTVVRIAGRLGASREDCLTVLRALGLAPDPAVGTATNDLGIRKQEKRKPRAEGPGAVA